MKEAIQTNRVKKAQVGVCLLLFLFIIMGTFLLFMLYSSDCHLYIPEYIENKTACASFSWWLSGH